MIEALRAALMGLLVGDAALLLLLAPDPRAPSAPAVFNAPRAQAPPALPCLTYRIASAVPDHRFRRPLQPLTGAAPQVEAYAIEIEAWAGEKSAKPLERIRERLDALLNDRALETAAGRVFDLRRQISQLDQIDRDAKAFFDLHRYQALAQRAP